MNIKELKQAIKDIPDEMPVGISLSDNRWASCYDYIKAEKTKMGKNSFHREPNGEKEAFIIHGDL